MSAERTAWHPPFTTLLRERAPHWAKVTGELQLTQEPARADDCLEVRVDVARDPDDVGDVLRGLWPDVRCVALLEFKSVSRPFRRGDLARLLAYIVFRMTLVQTARRRECSKERRPPRTTGTQGRCDADARRGSEAGCAKVMRNTMYGLTWFYAHQSHDALTVAGDVRRRASTDDLTLVLVVPAVTPTLLDEIAQLRGLALTRRDDGYHRLDGAFCTAVVVEMSLAAAREHNELMAWFAGQRHSLSVETRRWIRQNTSEVSTMDKASPELEGYDEWIEGFFNKLPLETKLLCIPPEQRLAGIDPEQRLAGIDPEQRLAGIDPAHQILALADEVLRGMPDSYLATLPDDVQARLRARIGRPPTR